MTTQPRASRASAPLFAKRHYEAIARVLAASRTRANIAHGTIAGELARMLADDNPRFNRHRFLTAAGALALEDHNRV